MEDVKRGDNLVEVRLNGREPQIVYRVREVNICVLKTINVASNWPGAKYVEVEPTLEKSHVLGSRF